MNTQQLKEDILSGVFWDSVVRNLRLGCNTDTISIIFSYRYQTTKSNIRKLIKRESRKRLKPVKFKDMNKTKKDKTEHRNQLIKFRFYDLHEKERLRVDDVVKRLSEEFFLSEIRIVEIIRGAISTGEMPITQSSIIKAFNKPTRVDNKNKYLDSVVSKLKEQYGQEANRK